MRNRFKRQYFEIIIFRVYSNLKAEATRGYLGFFWWGLEPLLFMTAFYVVFALGLRGGGKEGFVAFLLCGLTAWKWFASSLIQGARSVENSVSIMRQVYIPKYIFSYAIVCTNTVKFFIIETLLILLLIIIGYPFDVTWLSLPVLVFSQFLLILALSSFLSAIVPLIPDLKFVVENVVLFLMFVSGIFFDISQMPADIKTYFILNPVAQLLINYRKVLLHQMWPDWWQICYVSAISVVIIFITMKIFKKYDKYYLKVL